MVFQIYQDARKEFRWRLVAANGRILADSAEGYEKIQDCMKGLRLVRGSTTVPIRRIQAVRTRRPPG